MGQQDSIQSVMLKQEIPNDFRAINKPNNNNNEIHPRPKKPGTVSEASGVRKKSNNRSFFWTRSEKKTE